MRKQDVNAIHQGERDSSVIVEALARPLAAGRAEQDHSGFSSTLISLLGGMPEAVTVVGADPDFPVLVNSASVARILGRSASELGAVRVADHAREFGLLLPDGVEPAAEQSPLWRATHRGEIVESEEWLIQRPDGGRRLVCVSATPLRDANGQIFGAIQTWRDITVQKRSENFVRAIDEINAKIHAVQDLSEIMTVAMRVSTRATATESAAISLLEGEEWRIAYVQGFPAEVVGMRMIREDEPHAMLALETNHPVAIDDAFVDPRVKNQHMKDWGVRSVLVVPLVIGGEPLGVLFLNSHRRQLQFDELDVDFASRLGTTLGLAVQNASIITQLRDVDRKRMQFVALLSHELRNPLTPIKNCLYLLDKVPAGGQQAERARATLNRQVDLLTRLVDDVLDVSRLTSGKLRLERTRIDLAEVILRIAEDNRTSIENAGLFFEIELESAPVHISGDANRIAQVVSNLLTNSMKFTPAGGRVSLRLARVAKAAIVSVCDTGSGIDPANISKLFQPFMQAESSLEQNKTGLGLGLALVKGVAELHGGTAEARSRGLGHGAEFIIRFPVDEGAELVAPTRTISERPSARNVLVVDDNVDTAESLRDLLESSGHVAHAVYGGAEAIAQAEQMKPDVILCDIDMPAVDGIAVAKAIRLRPELRSAFLVAITGYGGEGERWRAIEAGFDAYLRKPTNFAKILELIENLPQ